MMDKKFWDERNRQRLEIREPLVGDWYKLQKFVESLRIEYDNFVAEFGSKRIGPFVIEGGYGLENCKSIFEWLEQLKEMEKVENNSVSMCPTKVFVVYDNKDNEIVGVVGVRFIPESVRCCDVYGNVALTIGVESRRMGIATFVMEWVFENWEKWTKEIYKKSPKIGKIWDKIELCCLDWNLASKYCMESLGYKFEFRFPIGDNTHLKYSKKLV